MIRQFLLLLLLISTQGYSQLTGTINVPGDYPDLAAAVTALNTNGVGAGGVVINISANQTTSSGFLITASGSTANRITLQGNGHTLTRIGTSGAFDGVIVLAGADYINILNCVLNGDAATEWGIALLMRNSTAPYNGAQNNRIAGNTINLVGTNENSVGVYSNAHDPTASFTLSATALSDANNSNEFYQNTITGPRWGIFLGGSTALIGYCDKNLVRRNTITYGATSPTMPISGIRLLRYVDITVDSNVLSVPQASSYDISGIVLAGAVGITEVSDNTITLNGNGGGGLLSMSAISHSAPSGAPLSVFRRNTITGCRYAGMGSGSLYGIFVNFRPSVVVCDSNVVNDIQMTGGNQFGAVIASGSESTTCIGNRITGCITNGASVTCLVTLPSNCVLRDNRITNNGGANIPASNGGVTGIVCSGDKDTTIVANNIISNLFITGTQANETEATGMRLSGTFARLRVDANQIAHVRQECPAGDAVGITFLPGVSAGSQHSITANRIYDIRTNGVAGKAYGLRAEASTECYVVNNLIGDINAPFSNANPAIAGIYMGNTVGSLHCYHNTIYLDASSTAANFGSAAFYVRPTVPSGNFRLNNNIFCNRSSPGPSGISAAIHIPVPMTAYLDSSDNNLYWAGRPGTRNVVFYDGTFQLRLLSAFQGSVAPRDLLSKTGEPRFITTDGDQPDFLHLASTDTIARENGIGIAGVNTDVDGQTRKAKPDIGADEFALAGSCSAAAPVTVSAITTSSATVAWLSGTPATYSWELRSGTAPSIGAPIQAAATNNSSTLLNSLAPATTYTIFVRRVCGASEFSPWVNASFTTPGSCAAPSVLQPPLNVTACEGQPAPFFAGITGSGPFTYQWYRGGNSIPYQNAPEFVIDTARLADAGSYRVEVRGNCGFTSSVLATLTVLSAGACNTATSQVDQPFGSVTLRPSLIRSGTSLHVQALRRGILIWRLTDMRGATLQLLRQTIATGSNRIDLDLTGLQSGAYQLQGEMSGARTVVLRLVKL